jgi:hypothetical protein
MEMNRRKQKERQQTKVERVRKRKIVKKDRKREEGGSRQERYWKYWRNKERDKNRRIGIQNKNKDR